MNSHHRSLTSKIGFIIILTELIVLIAVGIAIVWQYSREIDANLESRILLPAAIIAKNRADQYVISNQETLERLVGVPVQEGLLVSPDNVTIFQASQPELLGKRVEEVADIQPEWFDSAMREPELFYENGRLISITPILSDNGRRILYFVFVRANTASVQAQKAALLRTFLFSTAIIVGLTSLIIILSFNRLILSRITAVLNVLRTAESGQLSVRLPIPIDNDEISTLQDGVNSLIGRLETTVANLTNRISEQHLIEAALRQSEEKYRDFVESTDDLIIQLDQTGHFIYANHTVERIYGCTQEELIGQPALDFTHPADHERSRQALEEWVRGHQANVTFENRQVSRQGDIFHISWGITIHFDQYGKVNYLNAIGRDITDRTHVEAQLQLQSAALEAAANGIVITDPQGKVQWVNPAFTRLTGYTLAEVVGQDMNILNSGEQAAEYYQELWQTVLSGKVWQGELINRRKDGRHYFEEMTITPVFNAAGEITNFIAIKQDISERKQAEAELRERATSMELIAQVGRRATAILELDELLHQSVQLISNAFNYYNVVIRLIEDDYVVLKATSLLSLQPLEGRTRLKLGQGITGWVAQHDVPLLVPDVSQDPRYHAELSAMETVSEVAVPIKLKGAVIGVLDTQSVQPDAFDEDDVFTLQAIAAQLAVAIENARLYDAARQEILERRNAQEQLKIYTAELERSNRELENFAYVSSHDLQEPLRKIQMFGDRLAMRYRDQLEEQGQDYLARMQNAAGRMQALIQDLLAFSRVMTRNEPFVAVDLGRVVQTVLAELETTLSSLNGRVQLDPLPTIQADPTQMHQLFQNLISNGLKYHKPEEPPHLHVFAQEMANGHCQIHVQDNGIGFDEKYLDRIFTVFQRLHGRLEYEGTGIGLAISRRIVERHGGQLTAVSQPGQGATFIVTLPDGRLRD
jgi:PAS domain S-box-containing protein